EIRRCRLASLRQKEGEMRLHRRQILQAAAFAAMAGTARIALAQTYPARPITLIVPFPAGGTADPVGRLIAERMRAALGQSVVVENITGANGNIGTARLARAPGDGHTIGMG